MEFISHQKIPEVKNIIDFINMPQGIEFMIPVNILQPSQADDGELSFSWNEPISLVATDDKLLILHGNHRYYEARKVGMGQIRGIKISEPIL